MFIKKFEPHLWVTYSPVYVNKHMPHISCLLRWNIWAQQSTHSGSCADTPVLKAIWCNWIPKHSSMSHIVWGTLNYLLYTLWWQTCRNLNWKYKMWCRVSSLFCISRIKKIFVASVCSGLVSLYFFFTFFHPIFLFFLLPLCKAFSGYYIQMCGIELSLRVERKYPHFMISSELRHSSEDQWVLQKGFRRRHWRSYDVHLISSTARDDTREVSSCQIMLKCSFSFS